jgi:signal transduction histidine kinase
MKDDFVSVASHELRTPMTAIKSYLWMALAGKGGKLSEKQAYYLNRSYNSTDRLIKLVNDMLNISRIDSGRISVTLDKVNIVELAQEVIEEVKPRADELKLSLVLEKSLAKKDISVIADKEKIKEVLINLIGNSLKFTPEKGTITIHFEKKEDKIFTHVTDTGRGIDVKDLSTLFRKFGMIEGSYATNKKASGTGLGLYISKSIVDLHDGEITGSSEGIGKGSTFSISLLKFTQEKFQKLSKKSHKGTVDIIHSGL